LLTEVICRGYKGRIVSATETHVRMELEAQYKTVTVPRTVLPMAEGGVPESAGNRRPASYDAPQTPGYNAGNRTPGYAAGNRTPMHAWGSRTPQHPGMTPSHPGSAVRPGSFLD
jgi:transcription elongation factor SPT5